MPKHAVNVCSGSTLTHRVFGEEQTVQIDITSVFVLIGYNIQISSVMHNNEPTHNNV